MRLVHLAVSVCLCSVLWSALATEECAWSGPVTDTCPASETSPLCMEFDPTLGTAVIRDSGGRLGNQMFSYMLLAALRIRYGMRPFLTRRMHSLLSPYFHNLDMDVAEDTICDFEDMYRRYKDKLKDQRLWNVARNIEGQIGAKLEWSRDEKGRLQVPPEVAQMLTQPVDRIIHSTSFNELSDVSVPASRHPWTPFFNKTIFELENDEWHVGKSLILFPEGYMPTVEDAFKFNNETPGLIPAMERAFTLRPVFVDAARQTLDNIAAQHLAKLNKKKKKGKKKTANSLTFVGIHHRRTDHHSFEAEKGDEPIKGSYFLEAMDLFREEMKNVVFVYISDDLDWGKSFFATKNKAGDLYFAGEGRTGEDSIGHDLAVMAQCNHTIISYGTFSYWCGFLAGGAVVMPPHFPKYASKRIKSIYFAKNPIRVHMPRLHGLV